MDKYGNSFAFFRKNVAFSALSENVPPSYKITSLRGHLESLGEKVTQVLLRRKVVICYDGSRF